MRLLHDYNVHISHLYRAISQLKITSWTLPSFWIYHRSMKSLAGQWIIMAMDKHTSNAPMQPMQRYLHDPSPFNSHMLYVKSPSYNQYANQYQQQWPMPDYTRNVSPDRTSASGNSSYATHSEIRSPHTYHAAPYGSPVDFSQSSLPYPSTEHPYGGSCLPLTPVAATSINPRDIEYEHREQESAFEDVENIETKPQTNCDHSYYNVEEEMTTPPHSSCADSGIGHSPREAEFVESVDMRDDVSSDPDYSPLSRSSGGKRRRFSASNSGSDRVVRRRSNARKDSHVFTAPNTLKPAKRSRKNSSTTKDATDSNAQPDDRRYFPCPLATYGCSSNFSSKNEWKRHVSTQHIKLSYWRCDLCPPKTDPSDGSVQYFNDFNRKDLFTQHLRRMHASADKGLSRGQKGYPVNEDNLPEHQKRCLLQVRSPPPQSSCLFCPRTFHGLASWEERMEHVGRHLEKDRKSDIDMLDSATWIPDPALEQYLSREGLIAQDSGRWKIGDGKRRQHTSVDSDDESDEE
ncbi:hypothetical protein ACN47E_002862 [Coniothyrium glycines]